MDPYKTWTPNEPNTTSNFSNRRLNSQAESMNAEPEYPDNQNSTRTQNAPSEQNDRQPRYAGSYTVIPPNESRRSKLQSMAQKEEQDLQRWKEENRPGPIDLPPSQLGGALSLAEVRKKQFVELRPSKLQKKLKQDEIAKKRKEQEEEENQQKKAIQREKADKLQEKNKSEEQQRKCQFRQDRQEKMEQFLQSVDKSSSAPTATSSSQPASSWARGRGYREAKRQEEEWRLRQNKEEQRRKSELRDEKERRLEEERQREIEMEHRRVNSAFLDRLEGRPSSVREAEPAPATPEDSSAERGLEPQVPNKSLAANLSPGAILTPGLADSTEEDGNDRDWVVMKLINAFPFCERDFLEEIVDQCNGDYQQAYSLLQ